MKIIFKRAGFSLVQMIITMGLMSGVMVSAFKILQQQVKVGKSSSADFEAIYLVDEINSLLSNVNNCSSTFTGKFAQDDNATEINEILGSQTNSVYQVNAPVGKTGLSIVELRLNGSGEEFSPQLNQTLLKIKIKNMKERNVFYDKAFPIHITTNETGQIVSCFSLGGVVGSYSSPFEKNGDSTLSTTGRKIIFSDKEYTTQQDVVIDKALVVKSEYNIACTQELNSMFSYNDKSKVFKVCSGGVWKDIPLKDNSFMKNKIFKLSSSIQGNKAFKIEAEWKHCFVRDYSGEGGSCEIVSLNRGILGKKWEAIIKKIRGTSVSCTFQCVN